MKIFTPISKTPSKIITRSLQMGSTILVKEGDKVTPSDLIGETKPSAGFHIVSTPAALGVNAKEAAQHIIRKEGEHIYKGEVLAKRTKMFSKDATLVISPIDGVIQHIDSKTGQILIKMIRKQEYIPSGVWGKIIKITDKNEIQIETQVLEVTGQNGRGFERVGAIKVIANPHETIYEQMIKEEHAGKIVVGGSLLTREAIHKCVSLGVVGCVTGGIDYKDILAITPNSDIGVSIITLEGYGILSINEEVYNTLARCDNYYSFINGKAASLIIPMEKIEPETKKTSEELMIGSKVRVTFDNYLGQVGEVKEILPNYQFPSGIRSQAAKIIHKNTEQIIPTTNIEILA